MSMTFDEIVKKVLIDKRCEWDGKTIVFDPKRPIEVRRAVCAADRDYCLMCGKECVGFFCSPDEHNWDNVRR